MSDSKGEEIEREATRLPAFYRDVLLSEIKTRKALGSQFGSGARINLKGVGRDAANYFEEIGRTSGTSVKMWEWSRKLPPATFDLDLKDAWGMEALIHVSDRAKVRLSPIWSDNGWYFYDVARPYPGQPEPPLPTWFFYRNIAVMKPGPRWRKLVDFGGPPQWRAILGFWATVGLETPVVAWKDFKVLEISGEDGKELKQAPPEDTAIPGYQPGDPSGLPGPMDIVLEFPDRKERVISRLRYSVVGRVPQSRRTYVLTPESPKVEDDHFELSVRDPDAVTGWGGYPEVRIRPKKVAHETLAGVPFTFKYTFDTKMNAPSGGGGAFSGKGEATVVSTARGSLKKGGSDRQLLRLELIVPVDLQDRPVYVEFKDIPLR